MKRLLLVALVCSWGFADVRNYSSGLFESLDEPRVRGSRLSEGQALSGFFRENFPLRSSFQWVRRSVASDLSHRHHRFELKYLGRRVAGVALNLHYNRDGWIDQARSTWKDPLGTVLPSAEETARHMAKFRRDFNVRALFKYHKVPDSLRLEPVLWYSSRRGAYVAALQVDLLQVAPRVMRRFFVEESTGEFLAEQNLFRGVTGKIYEVSPLASATTYSTVTLSGLLGSFLESNEIHVRREQASTDVTDSTKTTLEDVTAGTDFTAVGGYDTDPDNYDHNCKGSSTECGNQGFDAQNVYHHVQNYRHSVDDRLSELGIDFEFQPTQLDVIVNLLSLDTDSDSIFAEEVNNAAYYSGDCVTGAGEEEVSPCLFFLRPLTRTDATCGGSTKFYDLARETLVITHEYQHFITDKITAMEPGGLWDGTAFTSYNVGDGLHEGYSDYFAASFTSHQAGTDVTYVGEYAFQNCLSYARDVAVLRPYQNLPEDEDPHLMGLSWASGLWKLREEFGRDVADLIAYKSLFYLSTRPGFQEAVESLVRADESVFGGAHTVRIRELFYKDLTFLGGTNTVFRDLSNGIVETGVRGCASVKSRPSRRGAVLSLILLCVWGMTVFRLGRSLRPRT